MKRTVSSLLWAAVLAAALAAAIIAGTPNIAHAAFLDLSGYQTDDGAITLGHEGGMVDPYYATQALLLARQGGIDITRPAAAWIAWMLPRQRPDGRFERHCRDAHTQWRPCAPVDAQDALLAQWLELLYAEAPEQRLPPSWQASAQLAWRALARLRDPDTGLYLAGASSSLFIDNVEIYAALASMAQSRRRSGETREADTLARRAETLRQGIEAYFPRPDLSLFPQGVATAAPQSTQYPEYAMQLHPLLYRMPLGGLDERTAYAGWMSRYAADWLSFATGRYPWGSIALAALAMGDLPTARCWRARAEALRHGERWSVVDEAAYQRIRFVEPVFSRVECKLPATRTWGPSPIPRYP